MEKKEYHPEEYWSKVGQRIEQRDSGKNVVAGDDEPYYRYKREQFLHLLHGLNLADKSVLEIGSGPGGNLIEVFKHKPKRLVGVDISNQMVKLASNKVPQGVEVIKIDGTKLPFADQEFDVVFTATVLQHNTNEAMLIQLMNEISRVSKSKVYLFERIEDTIKGDDLCLGRPVDYYEKIMAGNGFQLESKKCINIRVSYYLSGAIRKGLNPQTREEGEPLNKLSTILQQVTLPVTKILDKVFTSNKDVCRLTFQRTKA